MRNNTKEIIEGKLYVMTSELFNRVANVEDISIQLKSQFKPAAEYDGMLGSIAGEMMIGEIFSTLANDNNANSFAGWASQSHIDLLIEATSEYLSEDNTKGQGTFAKCDDNVLRPNFTAPSTDHRKTANKALEATIVALQHQLDWESRTEHTASPLELAA